MKYYPKNENKDHVMIQMNFSIVIGVDEDEDDTPNEFCNLVREAIKSTGAIVLCSSIVAQKRMNYRGSVREAVYLRDQEDNYGH